jgi:hypothetical protein
VVIVGAMEAGVVVMDEPPYITEEAFIEIGAPEWVWLAFREELKEYFNIHDDADDNSDNNNNNNNNNNNTDDEASSVCPHCRMAVTEVVVGD